MSHRHSLLAVAALLLRQMEELTEDLVHHTRSLEEIRSEAFRIQTEWKDVMEELETYHQPLSAMRE